MSDESTPAAANEDASEAQAPDQAGQTPVADEAPAQERPEETPAAAEETPAADAAAPDAEPDQPATEQPASEAPASDAPASDAPASEAPASDAPAPAAEAPAAPAPEEPKPARPPVTGSSAGTGRRKEAVARVRLVPGSGRFDLGGRTLEQAFPNRAHRMEITAPLRLVDHEQDIDVLARLTGGGVAGQAGALRHGIARALVELDPGLRPALKAEGFLTRDSREKERRKYGLKKARKAPQYSKR